MQKSLKVAMRLAYNGGAFYGFQSQKEVLSISRFLQEKLKSVGIFSTFVASGRTDKGVHASAQVISLKIPIFWADFETLRHQLNTKLSPYIYIKRIWQVRDDFNARFHAKRRGYCYLLSKRNSPFLESFALPYYIQNIAQTKEALQYFVGKHDFRAFMKNGGCGEKNSVRVIFRTDLRENRNFFIISFWGNGFLRAQIRLMVGFLLEIDRGHLSIKDLEAQLKGERIFTIPIVANGLFLTRVDYT